MLSFSEWVDKYAQNFNRFAPLLFFLLFGVYMLVNYLNFRLKNNTFITWWEKQSPTKTSFDYKQMLMSQESNLFSWLYNAIIDTPMDTLTNAQVRFVMQSVVPRINVGNDKSLATGAPFVTARHFTDSILFNQGEDAAFDAFTSNHYASYPAGAGGQKDPKATFKYPDTADRQAWKQLFVNWGACPTYPYKENPEFVVMVPASSQCNATKWRDGQKIEKLYPTAATPSGWFQQGPEVTIQATNVFQRYGILPSAPIITAFLNNNFMDPSKGTVIDPQAFTNLLEGGNGNKAGGWIGYLRGLGDRDYDYYMNLIYSTYPTHITPGEDCQGGRAAASGALSGIVSGIGIGAMFLMGPEMGPLMKVVSMVGSIAVASGAQAVSSYYSACS